MVTRELVKAEIDKVQESSLEILYRIIKALVSTPDLATAAPQGTVEIASWRQFIQATYGSLADAPIERGEQERYAETATSLQ